MPNNEAMTGLDPKAYRPPNAVWNGTDIRLQSEFLITGGFKPGLEAGGSSLKNAIKAQVYLTDINDLPALLESKIDINILGVRDSGKVKKQNIDHKASATMRPGPAAVCAGHLPWLSALYAADGEGAIPAVRNSARLRHVGAPSQHQMRAILGVAEDICSPVLRSRLAPCERHRQCPFLAVTSLWICGLIGLRPKVRWDLSLGMLNF